MTVDNSFTMKKFQSMEIIYVTFSQITKLPYVECDPETFDDQVYMFTEEEAAKEFAKSYVEKNTPLLTVKVLRKQMPNFYMGLYAEGVNMVIFHEGDQTRRIELEQIFPKPDMEKMNTFTGFSFGATKTTQSFLTAVGGALSAAAHAGFVAAPAPAYVAGRTPLGRQIYAIGGNERASLLSGVYVNRVKVIVYVISGFCAAIVGLIISSQLVASHPATGTSFEMNAIAAAVLGGTSLAGGRGTSGGTIIGASVIGVLSDGLVMMGVSEFWQMVIKGLVIIAAVVLDQMQRKMAKR